MLAPAQPLPLSPDQMPPRDMGRPAFDYQNRNLQGSPRVCKSRHMPQTFRR